MKNWTIVLSAVLLGAGCAHHDANYQGAAATDWSANNSVTSDSSSSNTKGAGARAITGDTSVTATDPSGTTSSSRISTDNSTTRTTEASAENSKGAGSQEIIRRAKLPPRTMS
jgi:hypothetical protein